MPIVRFFIAGSVSAIAYNLKKYMKLNDPRKRIKQMAVGVVETARKDIDRQMTQFQAIFMRYAALKF